MTLDAGWTHSLGTLLESCARLDESFRRWCERLGPLERYAVEVRYPGDYEPTSEEAQKALVIARELREFVLERVNQK